ncbi:hypothetical protein CDV36_001267 [Fusarium kuroshium]|uniref:Uncharacterized protein n=1 Tax=Fusarium kuroshium TaxID=2010991 RepID=A0A3M2SNA0_9HYPO|nr:hypothetical protein CDV36_001267 [Fusarium kuroshium]
MSNDFGDLIAQILCRGCLSLYIFMIEHEVIRKRRDAIIARGRQFQEKPRLPEYLRPFADQDPGMLDSDMRRAATMFGFSWLFSTIGLWFGIPIKGKILDPVVIGLGFVNPICVICIVWLDLVLAKRYRLRYFRRTGRLLGEPSLESDIGALWIFI